jgi:hypothetical protein
MISASDPLDHTYAGQDRDLEILGLSLRLDCFYARMEIKPFVNQVAVFSLASSVKQIEGRN